MSIGNTEVDFKEIYDAINGEGAHTTQEIGMDSFYDQPFTDGTSTPESGAISIGDIKGKTIETSLYDWSKLDGIWPNPDNGTNCGRALEIGWFDGVSTTDFFTTGSSANGYAEQIQNIKDWLEEQNVIKGYTYYMGFSFNTSYPTLPMVCKRTNGPDGEISAVSGLSTTSHSSWDLYYISNVFEVPGGIGNPLRGKYVKDILLFTDLIEWHPTSTTNKTGSQISITGSGLNTVIKSTASNTRTNVYFTSKTQIYDNTSIKFQSVIGVSSTSPNNFHLGIGNGTFSSGDGANINDYTTHNFYVNSTSSTNNEWNALITGNTTNHVDGWFKAYPHQPFVTNSTHPGVTGIPGDYATNDIFEIKIQNGFVSFWKNDVVLWNPQQESGKVDFSTPKYLMGTMYRYGAGVKNIIITLI